AARTCSSAPAKTAATMAVSSSSGNAAIESASSGTPPIAKTSLSAFVAAIRPKTAGSSTSGGKKSTDALNDVFARSEEHTSELQSRSDLVCRLLLEKKKIIKTILPIV